MACIFPGLASLEILQKIQRETCKIKTLNLTSLKIGTFSCQCSMISNGQRKEILKSVFRIPNKSRNTRRGSRVDTGHSSTLDTKRNGMEISVQHLKENEISPPQEHQCFESWNSEKKTWQRYHTLQRGCFERRALFQMIHSENQLRIFGAVSSWCEEFGLKPNKRKLNEQILKGVTSQEVNSSVPTQGVMNSYLEGNRVRERLQNFETL